MADPATRPGDNEAAPANMVDDFRRRVPAARAVKGRDVMGKPYTVSRVKVDVKGRTTKASVALWHLVQIISRADPSAGLATGSPSRECASRH